MLAKKKKTNHHNNQKTNKQKRKRPRNQEGNELTEHNLMKIFLNSFQGGPIICTESANYTLHFPEHSVG